MKLKHPRASGRALRVMKARSKTGSKSRDSVARGIAGVVSKYQEQDGFTIAKPRNRADAEATSIQLSRYKVSPGNFDRYSPYELGADVTYSYGRGATIVSVKSGSVAASAGLKVGDMILEVDGAPIGVFGDRTYEVWQQYKYSKEGKVELLIAFDRPDGTVGYFYPQLTLTPRQISN